MIYILYYIYYFYTCIDIIFMKMFMNIPLTPLQNGLSVNKGLFCSVLIVTSSVTNAVGHSVTRQTAARRLGAHEIRVYSPHRGYLLTAHNRRLELRWALTVRLRQPRD